MTPPVARTCQSLNQERLSICKALGYKVYHWNNLEFENYRPGETEEECRYRILNTRMDAAFGKDGIYAGSKMKGPEHLKDRYVTEDGPYGMVLFSTLGDILGVPTPTHDAVIQLASSAIGPTTGRPVENQTTRPLQIGQKRSGKVSFRGKDVNSFFVPSWKKNVSL
jgi:opine dehydrogenase